MNVEKLKQKILDLAIRGKLVPQDPNDEPASVLIEKIRAEKEALIKQGKIKRDKNESYIFKGDDNSYYEKVGGKITKIEVPFEIPSNWSWARLTQIIDVRDGTHDSPKYIKSGIPFVTCKNLKNGTIDYSSCKYISEADAIKINMRSNVDDGDILFAMIGTIGNPVVVKKEFDFCIKNVALLKNIDINCLNNFWLKAFIEYYSDTMKRQTSSGLQPFVSLEFIRNLIIPVPPYIEQCKILHKMERIMEIVLLIQKETVKIRKLVEILKFKILDSIFSENSRYKSYYGKRTKTTLEKLIPNEKIGDGDWVLSEDMNPNGDIQILQLKHIGNMVYQNKSFCHIDENFFKEHNCSEIKENYLLINRLVASSMACCLMPQTNTKTITSVDVCWIAPDETYNSKYIMYYLSSKNFQNKVLMLCSGSTRKRISKKNLTRIPLFIHDRMQQDIIVNRIENLFELVEKVIG